MKTRLDAALAIEGWMSRDELAWLAQQARVAKTVVEIGCFQGRSTRALADHCRGVVYAIDPWDGYINNDETQATWITKHHKWSELRGLFERHLADHLATGRVVMVPYSSAAARPVLFDTHGVTCADFVFIDGDHREAAVREDIAQYRTLVPTGGILAGHDYGHKKWPGVRRAVDDLFGADVQRAGESIWWVRCGS